MRPRKPSKLNAVAQVNLRIDERLRRQLEAAARERHITFSQEVRLRLISSFEQKSLDDLRERIGRLEERVESERVRRLEEQVEMRNINHVRSVNGPTVP
jgi:hypothetical protein